jgi:hypothetical protein
MRRAHSLLLTVTLLFITAHRLPAPIQEVPESPTPKPEPSSKPKPKRTIKSEPTRENSESSTKNRAPSPTPSLLRNPFDGTWVGGYKTGWAGDVQYTYVISGAGTVIREISDRFGTNTYNATCDGTTMRWTWKYNTSGVSTFTPSRDGTTASFTVKTSGIGGYETSTVFRRVSQ